MITYTRAWFGAVGLLVGGFVVSAAGADNGLGAPAAPAPNPQAGKKMYEQHCARCHGVEGNGRGPDAPRLVPQPRDFTVGTFKIRSTASGTPPTDEDLYWTVTKGLPGSGMPAWGGLSDEERWQLVYYVKQFANFGDRKPEPVSMGKDPGSEGADLAKGRRVYDTLQCAACHGKLGRGDGPSAPSLVDDWNQPIRAANLTQGWTYRGGSHQQDIYLRFTAGIDGTPMPSYAEAASDEDRWQLAYYVQSLQEEPHWEMAVPVARAAGALPATPGDPAWSAAPAVDLGMQGLVYVAGATSAATVKAVRVQALTDGQELTLRLSWDDPTLSSAATPPDALAVAFRPEQESGPLPPASWYNAPPVARDLCYWSSAANAAREQVATTVAPMARDRDTGAVRISASTYEDGRWALVLRRPLRVNDLTGAVTLAGQQAVPFSVAIWDGGRQEEGRHGAFSTWVPLVFDSAASAHAPAAGQH